MKFKKKNKKKRIYKRTHLQGFDHLLKLFKPVGKAMPVGIAFDSHRVPWVRD